MTSNAARFRRSDGDAAATVRSVVVLVLLGVVMGVTHNALALRSKPARGLAWRANTAPLAALEESPAIAPAAPAPQTAETTETGPIEASVLAPPPAQASTAAKAARPAAMVPAAAQPAATPAARETTAVAAATPSAPPMVIPESAEPRTVTRAQVDRLLAEAQPLVLDARTADEFAEGHLPGARSLSYDALGGDVEPLRGLCAPTQPVLVYCGGDGCPLSRELGDALARLGYRRVLVYEGGTADWLAAGRTLVRAAPETRGGR